MIGEVRDRHDIVVMSLESISGDFLWSGNFLVI
jgi:hypothetical protein